MCNKQTQVKLGLTLLYCQISDADMEAGWCALAL